MTPDHINAVFEGGGAVLLCLNVRRLYTDKRLQGVSLFPTVWWNIWGFWNVYYYSALSQPLSFWAGLGVVVLNTVWVALALWYRFGWHKVSMTLPRGHACLFEIGDLITVGKQSGTVVDFGDPYAGERDTLIVRVPYAR